MRFPTTDVILSAAKNLRFASDATSPVPEANNAITFGIQTITRPPTNLDSMRERCYYTYITASRTHVLYIGVTNSIERRIIEHKNPESDSFTAKYNCNRLVWFERHSSPAAAIARENELKGWKREKKIALIQRQNPTWIDLSENWGKSFL